MSFPSCESCLSDELLQSCGRKASGETAFGESQEMSEHTWQMQMLPYGARVGALPSWVVGWVRKQRESYITAFTVTSSLPDTYESSWSDMTDKCRRSNRKCKTKKNGQQCEIWTQGALVEACMSGRLQRLCISICHSLMNPLNDTKKTYEW